MHAGGATHDPRHRNVSFELLRGKQEQCDEGDPFEATREERHRHRRYCPERSFEHERHLHEADSAPDLERATAEGEVGDGPAQGALDLAQQNSGLERLDDAALVDLKEFHSPSPYGRHHPQGYTADR